MALPRTKTLELQDVILCQTINSVGTATVRHVVSPIAGYVERIMVCKGGAHSSGGAADYDFTIGLNSSFAISGSSGGAALDVDSFEFTPDKYAIGAGERIILDNNGNNSETEAIGITVVIKRR